MSKPTRLPGHIGGTFFVTTSSTGHRFFLQSERMASLLVEVLQDYRQQGKFLLHAYVVMPNHLHVLITPAPGVELAKAVQFIKGGFSFRARQNFGITYHPWQTGFSDHHIRDARD